MAHFIVIGAGQAGASLVAKLRKDGFDGDITLIGAEPVPPYQRPPLSKAYLLGDMALERLFLRPESFYADQNIRLITGTKVTAIDPAAHRVTLADGEVLTYDKLALTTGSAPRHLPASVGGDLGGVHVMRDLNDADTMAPLMQQGKHVLIVGGGYIGLEAAAVAAKKGLNVTLIEMGDRILQRVAAPETSDFFRDLHRSHGVDIRESIGLERLSGDGHVDTAHLSDGSAMSVDFVIVGIGIVPEESLAKAAGLTIDNGIATDLTGQTSDPDIYAAGDCASFPRNGAQFRLESVQNAIDQAELVASNMMGAAADYDPKPWFWSDQYDIKLQIAGLNIGYDHIVTRKGDGSTSFWYYAGDTLLAIDAMNDPRAYMVGKRLIEAGKSPDPAIIADANADLKPLLKA